MVHKLVTVKSKGRDKSQPDPRQYHFRGTKRFLPMGIHFLLSAITLHAVVGRTPMKVKEAQAAKAIFFHVSGWKTWPGSAAVASSGWGHCCHSRWSLSG